MSNVHIYSDNNTSSSSSNKNKNNSDNKNDKNDTDSSTSPPTTPLASKPTATEDPTPPLPTPRPGAIASFSFACTSPPSPDLPRSHSSISTTSTDYDPTTPLLFPGRRYPIDRHNSSYCSQATSLSSDSSISSAPSFLPSKSNDVPQGPPHLGLASFLLWLKDHPSSSKVGSENMARFLLVKSVSIIAASLGCIYGILFDTGSTFSMYSLLLFFIPAIQGLTGATRICGLALSMAVAAVYFSFQNRLLPLLGPSLETTLLFGLPLVTGMLVGRKVGLLTSLAVIGFSIAEYRSRAKSADLTEDEASRLWAGFGAYWLSLLFFGTITCLYQWCVEVCVNDANLFKDIAIANAKSKDGVVSSVSHELRTPLAALIGWTELLLSDHTLSNSARSTVSMLHSSTLSLLTILNALLDVSKVSAAKMTTCSQNFNLHDLVLDTARMMTGLSGTRSVELLVDFSAQVPELVRADSGLIKQVLGNLVSNAIKFTDVGYVNVGVSLKDEDDDSVTVEFVVQDTGKGIPDEQKDKLFVEFSQVEGGKCKNHEAGTGLGLFLVKNLVELMKGTVFMQSEVGVGSTFGFVIKMEKQYLAFRTPGYDHVVTVSSAFQAGMAQQALDPSSPMLPVTPGLARSTTPLPPAVAAAMAATTASTSLAASSSDPEAKDPSKPKDYFNLQPVEETRANANNITLRTRDNAFLANRRYFIHSQCNYFEDFLWKTAAGPWQAIETRRLTYEHCVQGWEPEPMPAKPLALFGDVYLIDLSPTTNRPRNANELSDQEQVQQFLSKLARHLIKLAKMHIGKVRQASIILFYPFGHPPSLAQEPFVELSSLYQISLCRKPVSERALGSIVKRQQIVIQSNGEMTPDVLGPRASGSSLAPSIRVASGTNTAVPIRSSSPLVSGRQYSSDSTNSLTSEEGHIDSCDSKDSVAMDGSFVGEPSLDGFKLTLPKGGMNSIRKQANKLNGMNKAPEGGSSPATAAAAAVAATATATTASVRFAKRSGSSSSASTTSSRQSASSEHMLEKPVKSLLKNQNNLASMESIQDLNASGRRVLIVDDNIVNRNLLLQQLIKLGVSRIDQAKSGKEAVELFEPNVHSLVLMDLNMPAMNGFQATTLIREKEQEDGGALVVSTPTIASTSTPNSTRPEAEPTRRVSGLDHDSGSCTDDSPWLPELYVGHPGHFHRRSSGTEPHDKQGGSSPKMESNAAPSAQSNVSAGRGHRSVTIIALTADWTAEVGEEREKAINGGFDDVMVKPISLPSLSVLLNRYMINRVDTH
ncbi:MAG: hypothetical protein BYD32DRAFT_461112 [Podila humilis]|nr:MAG: hypothetical protein BYD32DRAFT_461112 [Podila humilis]